MLAPYADIECKQVTNVVLGPSVLSFGAPVAVSFYTALSREGAVMVAVLTVHAVANIVTQYERIYELGLLETCPIPYNGS